MTVKIDRQCSSLLEAERVQQGIYDNYPSPGYGTHVIIVPDGNMYRVIGYRSDSCD